jgi:hypothetical protein
VRRPPPQLTGSESAERHRMLGSRPSAGSGPWRTSRTPYLKGVMDALSAVHPAWRVVFIKGAQVGTTSSENHWLDYVMRHLPVPPRALPGRKAASRRSASWPPSSVFRGEQLETVACELGFDADGEEVVLRSRTAPAAWRMPWA